MRLRQFEWKDPDKALARRDRWFLDAEFAKARIRYGKMRSARIKGLPGASYTGGAGFKTVKNAAGLILSVGANEPGETDLGYQSWEPRQNFVPNSEDGSGSNWHQGNSTGVLSSFTFGGRPMFRFAAIASGVVGAMQPCQGGVSAVNGDIHVMTVAVLGDGSCTTCAMAIQGSSDTFGVAGDSVARVISGPASISQSVGSLWNATNLSTTVPTYFEITKKSNVTQTLSLTLWVQTSGGGSVVAGNANHFGVPQLEKATSAALVTGLSSPYIPTTGVSASRTLDALNWTLPFLPPAATVLFTTNAIPKMGTNSRYVSAIGGDPGFGTLGRWVSDTTLISNMGGGTQLSYPLNGTLDCSKRNKFAITWDASGRRQTVNGAAPSGDANTITGQALAPLFTIGTLDGTGGATNGLFEEYRIELRRFTDSELMRETMQ